LTKEAEILGRYTIAAGFKGVKVRDARILLECVHEKTKDSKVQLLDANLVAGWEHLYFAMLNAQRAFETGLNISKDLAVETLLYASGQHQIRKAVELLGVKPGSSNVAVIVMGRTKVEAYEDLKIVSDLLGGKISDETLDLTKEKVEAIRKLFNISDLEVNAASREENPEKTLVNLVIEHMALLTRHAKPPHLENKGSSSHFDSSRFLRVTAP